MARKNIGGAGRAWKGNGEEVGGLQDGRESDRE